MGHLTRTLFLAAFSLGTLPATAQPQPLTPDAALQRAFGATQLQAGWFAPAFLTQVPLPALQAQWDAWHAGMGALVRLDRLNGQPLLVFERGTLLVRAVRLDEQGRFTNLLVAPGPQPGEPADTDDLSAERFLFRLFAADRIEASQFSATFLQQVPAEELQSLFTRLREQRGRLRSVTTVPDGWLLTYERGELIVTRLLVNAEGQIEELLIEPYEPPRTFTSFPEARSAFAALPGKVSVLVQELGGPTHLELNSRLPLAVGSAFKLAVLGELQAQITAGKRSWTDEVTLTDGMKVFSSRLQDAPAGTRYTLRELATRMIAESDNTATDLLLDLVGRAGVEARLGYGAMVSTREAFTLKAPENLNLLRAYRDAGLNRDARRAVIAQAAALPLPAITAFPAGRTHALDVEWFVSTSRLCTHLREVAGLDLTRLNPGVADPAQFRSVSYKGGSEAGVLNLTSQVTTRAGRTYCVSATWNRPEPLNEQVFVSLYRGVLGLLK